MYLTEAVRRAQDILFPSKPRDAMPPVFLMQRTASGTN